MNLSEDKLRISLIKLNEVVKSSEISKILKKNEFSPENIDEIVTLVCDLLEQNPQNAFHIRAHFSPLLLPIVSSYLESDAESFEKFQRRCIALSILSENNRQVLRFTVQHLTEKRQSPFHKTSDATPKKKSKKQSEVSDLEIVESSLRLLRQNLNFFRRAWNWDEFIEVYHNKGCDLQKFLCNQVIGLLFGLTTSQLSKLNEKIPKEILVGSESKELVEVSEEVEGPELAWSFKSQRITDVEGVYLPIFDTANFQFYADNQEKFDKIIRVDSTKVNLRSLALGISSGKAICLSGPVGSGKTTLVEFLARKTGRIAPKIDEFSRYMEEKTQKPPGSKVKKRKSEKIQEESLEDSTQIVPSNGFLRIQLGDQTDSKVLLGQYRCTDVPGEFLWQPGVLTQAVLNGYWLLLEDLDSATQDVCTVLTGLLEKNTLSVPGFRENLKIAPGFQLFVTLRTQKSSPSANSPHTLLDKHLYTINIIPLSRTELSQIIVQNFPKLTTIAPRIVDVFLTFSSGCHSADEVARLPNSGRMVSTRDLLKLCKRSNPNFQITSVECAFFVFQNCVDLFASHLPAGPTKTDLIVSIGARLGIIESRCVHLSNDDKPQVTMTSDEITVGRATVSRNSKEEFAEKRRRVEDETHKKTPPPPFSFTRISSCILERIAVAVKQNEPVLLVGETGVGKTSSIQYLAHQTNHKLVVVNMNNQSDVSDLIGGFKPVDISFVIAPLRLEFEAIFARTFDVAKNEKFLNNVSVCFNRGDYQILVKLMLKITATAYSRKVDVHRWEALENKLKKLDEQLKNSLNLSFAFIPGSLVNCIRNGDWVLLDEINLASTETLECLSTILEPDGSVVLLERGDIQPVKRHPDFRIFSCMNPNTDVGKKDLPTGIRNRFSEFFVDELTSESDLLVLVGDYLNNTGIQKSRIFSAVKLYMKLRELSQLELNDGLGNKPVFSLRTLCRALKIAAKNLCGSIERNIYESFCLSFLTQLDSKSHDAVLKLIQKFLLSDAKKILSQPIPKPAGDFMNFEGYWIEVGSREPQEMKEYILTESVKKNLRDLSRDISIGKLPILLQGPTSAGKTSLIEFIARKSGNHCLRINNHEHTDLQEYIGSYTADATGKLKFQEGVLVQAMRNGSWIILDELNLAPSDILEALNRVLDDNRELFIPETQVLVKAHPNFMLFATQNPPGLYGGRKTLSRAFKNRFVELHFSEIPNDELEIILEKRCLIPKSYAQKMVRTMTSLQMNRRSTTKNNFTLRDLFRWGNRYTFADKKLLDDKNYDWNQHLIDEGYLVLSAKVRNSFESDIIIDALFHNFRKRVSVENLFTIDGETSKVTKGILEAVTSYQGQQDVVWTFEMRRMAVLVSKSIEFNEPVLLVGPTGCGKTTVCQILAEIGGNQLRILNCHMHTEGADFLGGLRPYRESAGSEDSRQLFEWSNGPLVLSMIEGSFFLADEISLAEDSVLERLNCVLEPERTILLAEKGGIDDQKDCEVIKASDGFQFLATMNPGGDFGKKELSPALRNRFTEIWCTAINSDEDLMRIAENSLKIQFENRETDEWNEENLKSVEEKLGKIRETNEEIEENSETFDVNTRKTRQSSRKFANGGDSSEKLNENLKKIDENSGNSKKMIENHGKFDEKLNKSPEKSGKFDENPEESDKVQNPLKFPEIPPETITKIARIIILTVNELKKNVEKLNFSIRDVLAWVNYIAKNHNFQENSILTLNQALLYGLQTLFLDALEMLPYENLKEVHEIRGEITKTLGKFVKEVLGTDLVYSEIIGEVEKSAGKFGISPFYLEVNQKAPTKPTDFSFSAPTTKKNLFRVLSALSLNKAILLEGDPGVGKTSLIENIAGAIGYTIVRINLCEHTDLADLFGTDLPAESKSLEDDGDQLLGSFVWRDGPLLSALKAKNTWILLDELNLAPQSVLEGLNAILDHRGEVFIPELNKTFKLGRQTRIFAAQNPLRQGGGRKGLPQSFLNRFTKVYLRKLEKFDLLHVTRHNFGQCQVMQEFDDKFNVLDRMVTFSERLERAMANLEFGYKGGPYEANLRDILRWCKLLTSPTTGYSSRNFLLTLFEKMKLVYCQRMRAESDVAAILRIFGEVFECDVDQLQRESSAVALYWNDNEIFLNDIKISRNSSDFHDGKSSLILSNQLESLKNIVECVELEKPVIVCGPSDCGKTKIVDTFSEIANRKLYHDTIDDSVTGSFQQFDFNRLLEEVWGEVEGILFGKLREIVVKAGSSGEICRMMELFRLWQSYDGEKIDFKEDSELENFWSRLETVGTIVETLLKLTPSDRKLKRFKNLVKSWQDVLKRSPKILNTGGRFEWVDSVIVKAIKFGNFLALEHVNLASSAILDRLNPILEPNGTLLISEKGVGENNEPENIEKHANFRVFLTMDPKHGEISRAMRNRCIELAIPRENYSEDDLRKIIYVEGVHEMYLIRTIVEIHQAALAVSEFSTFGVSQLTKMAYLVAQNKAMGVSDRVSLTISALEVYVRSSNVDLLGLGLENYREKLREAIQSVIEGIQPRKNVVEYENMIVRSDELTAVKLVKLQSEVLLTVLRAIDEVFGEEVDRDGKFDDKFRQALNLILSDLHTNLKVTTPTDLLHLPKYLLTLLYIISSADDSFLRESYLGKRINDKSLLKISKSSSKIVREFAKTFKNLPWNSKIFPRLRPYEELKSTEDENRATLALLLEMTLEEIITKDSVNRNQIDVISYSKAVTKKLLSDVVENSLISNVFSLLELFKPLVACFLRDVSVKIDDKGAVKLLVSFLWFNRLLTAAKAKLYVNNCVDSSMIDELNLHFRWFAKHCVNLLNLDASQDFTGVFLTIQNFILSRHHPLKLHKKIYVKNFVNFQPFFEEDQVRKFLALTAMNEAVRIVPKMDKLYDFEEFRKRLVLMTSVSYGKWRQEFIGECGGDWFEAFGDCWSEEMKGSELVEKFEAISGNKIGKNRGKSEENVEKKEENQENRENLMEIDENPRKIQERHSKTPPLPKTTRKMIEEFQKFLKSDNEVNFRSSKFDIETLPIVEYFLIRVLQSLNPVNLEYIEEVFSINSDGLETILAVNDERFAILKEICGEFGEICGEFGENDERNLEIIGKLTTNCGENGEIGRIPHKPTEFTRALNSFLLKLTSGIDRITQTSLCVNSNFCRSFDNLELYDTPAPSLFINSPLLTSNLLQILLTPTGTIRGSGLGEINQWKTILKHLKNVLWVNAEVNRDDFNFVTSNLNRQIKKASKLLGEITVVRGSCNSLENENFSDFNRDFELVVEKLRESLKEGEKEVREKAGKSRKFTGKSEDFMEVSQDSDETLQDSVKESLNPSKSSQDSSKSQESSWYQIFLTNSLCGIIELNLLTHLPLMDPVKKNFLKTKYLQQDLDHLDRLLVSFSFMATVMDYENLGKESRDLLEAEVAEIQEKLVKNRKKVAVRAEICVYSSLVKDVNHFLASCCHPKNLLELVTQVQSETSRKSMEENARKLELWIINANKFESHTMQPYQAYYRDFVAPIETSIATLKNGFIGLRSILRMKIDAIRVRDNGSLWDVNRNGQLTTVLQQLIAFPTTKTVDNQKIFAILEGIPHTESTFMKLLTAEVQEILNNSTISGDVTSENFKHFEELLNTFNWLWQKQEELKKKRQEEEDSLYVTKTKCVEEDEEVVKTREIAEIFPNYAHEDFDEFLQSETLEQVVKVEKQKKAADIIAGDDYKTISDFFVALMNRELGGRDYLSVFEGKVKVFQPLFEQFKTCVGNELDDAAYRSLSLLVALCQESYDELTLRDPSSKAYNFYKDSNITEAIVCVEVLKKLETRVKVELEQWPEHAVLNDLIILINRIRGFSSTSPLARFNTGLQILRQKVDEWNSVAHRLNNFKDLEYEIAELVQKWMRLELQCWRESLNQSLEMSRSKAHRYWFFLYNLVHEFLADTPDTAEESSLVDFKDVEKRFAGNEVVEETKKVGKVSVAAITRVLEQFMESSSYAEFATRLKLLKSFEFYLELGEKSEKKSQLIAILHNLHSYFSQFSPKVQEQIEFVRKPVEKKLKEFVKIESFNKDLSYFSMRSNIQRVHRHLHKIIKEFELDVTKKINDLLVYKDSNAEFHEFKQPQKFEQPKVETFIAENRNFTEIPTEPSAENSPEILQNLEKFFKKSRKIVAKALEGSPYPSLLESFQDLMDKQLETCLHLRSLEVDREQPRNKQKSQAKHILAQKRKALTDFFKSLTLIGVSYKTGLLTASLTPEVNDLGIKPFLVESFQGSIDLYYNKSVLKMKLLRNSLLMPRPDMDHAFLERIKGFSVDFFVLVRDQRKILAENVNLMENLGNFAEEIEIAGGNPSNFKADFEKLQIMENGVVEAVEVLEQFRILMKCSPEDCESRHSVLKSARENFNQKSESFGKIVAKTEEILGDLREIAAENREKSNKNPGKSSRFQLGSQKKLENFTKIVAKLQTLKEIFLIDGEISIYGKPIADLFDSLQAKNKKIEEISPETSTESIETELDDLAHSILIAIQKIYKRFEVPLEDTSELLPNQLKEKMHSDMAENIGALNLKTINSKLAMILDAVFISTTPETSAQLLRISPLVKQFQLLSRYFLVQQVTTHRLAVKMLSIMLSVFLELTTKGFCVPQDLLSDEEQKEENDTKTGDGFGFEDGDGEKDVSDKLESEDQLDEAKKPEDYDNKGDKEEKDCKEEEKGIDMNDDFEGKMQDVDKNDDDSDANEDENEELDKEMGETEEGADKLDDQVWGSDEEPEPEEEENDKNEESGKGSGEKDDKHNDMDTDKNDEAGQEEDGLDAADAGDDDKKQQQKKDIEKMDEQGEEEDQVNPFHNELEEPPQPDDLNLDEEMNLDNDDKEAKENPEENPFEIDKMKENFEETPAEDEEENEEKSEESEEKTEEKEESAEAEDDTEDTLKPDDDQQNNDENPAENPENPEENPPQVPDELEEKTEEKPPNPSEDFHESKDKKSKEDNIQSMPNQKQQASNDQTQVDTTDESAKQDADFDDQETGEDRDGVGQAENQESKTGHQGVADTKETQSKRNQQENQQQKRKMGNTDEERTLGEVDKLEKKKLKTVDKLNRESGEEETEENSEEFQHVKEAKANDKTTLDNATEEQSKEVRHDSKENEEEKAENGEKSDELPPEEELEEDQELSETLESRKIDKKSDKPSKIPEKSQESLEKEEVQVDGDTIETSTVPRGDETSAYCQLDLVNDASVPEEASTSELFEMRKMVESEVTSQKVVTSNERDMERWQEISNRMMPRARDLCEQLRLILEPTKCTRLKGDYRTGRRINMRKIVPYIASQFRKDKIWLRRTKAAQRDYKITIAVDDSKSMDHNNSKSLTMEAIALVSQALTLLESGKLCVMSFGEKPKILLKYGEQFSGANMVTQLNFEQNQSRIAELLNFSRTMNQEEVASDNGVFEHLLIVLSDGRNIFSEGEQKVRNAVKMARLQRMFVVYIIIDNPENKHSILDIRVPKFSPDMKTITMSSYLDTFPFPYYVIVRDLNQLPLVLSDGLRQWFELVNSEQ